MNKLADLFRKVGSGAPQSFGFGVATAGNQSPREIALIGLLESRGLTKRAALLKADVDAILVDCGGKPLAKSAAATLQGKLWGAGISGFGQDEVASLKDQGCDFLVFEPGSTSATVVSNDDMGSVIVVTPDLDRETARAIQAIEFTGAYLSTDVVGRDISVARLIDLQRVRSMINGPLVAIAPDSPTVSDLTVMRDAGISGLVAPLEDQDSIVYLSDRIKEIAPRRRSPGSRNWQALAPNYGTSRE